MNNNIMKKSYSKENGPRPRLILPKPSGNAILTMRAALSSNVRQPLQPSNMIMKTALTRNIRQPLRPLNHQMGAPNTPPQRFKIQVTASNQLPKPPDQPMRFHIISPGARIQNTMKSNATSDSTLKPRQQPDTLKPSVPPSDAASDTTPKQGQNSKSNVSPADVASDSSDTDDYTPEDEFDVDEPASLEEMQKQETGKVEKVRMAIFWKRRFVAEQFPDVSDNTELFLHFLAEKENWNALQDNKTRNSDVWKGIAAQMASVGCQVNEDLTTAKEIIENKWKYLKKKFKEYVDQTNTTGTGAAKLPPYYDRLLPLLGPLHDVNFSSLDTIDSMEDPESSAASDSDKNNQSMHENVNDTIKPPAKRKLDIVLNELAENRKVFVEKFDSLTTIFKEGQNKQLDTSSRMADSFEKYVNFMMRQPPPPTPEQ